MTMRVTIVVNGKPVKVRAPDLTTASELADRAAKKAGMVMLRPHAWILREGNTPLSCNAAYQWSDGTVLFAALDAAGCTCPEHGPVATEDTLEADLIWSTLTAPR